MSAFTGSTLDAKAINDVKDLQLITPGLQYDSMASYSIIFMRGVGSDAFQAGVDSAVATYVDDLYLPFTFSSAQALGDVQQIEVLKGPQGALYGRNAVAGAIVVKLKPPSRTFHASALASFGNYGDKKGKIAVSGPVPWTNDTLFYNVSYLYENHDAYTQYFVDPKQKYHSFRNKGVRAQLEWDPIDDVSLTATYYYLKAQDADSVATNLLQATPIFSTVLTSNTVPHTSGNTPQIGVFGRTSIWQVVAKEQLTPWFDGKFIYGHIRSISDIYFDFDSAPEPVLDISALPNTARSDSFETILTSNAEGTPDWLEWTAGAFYSNTTKTGIYLITVDALGTALGLPLSNIFGGQSPICATIEQLGADCNADPETNKNPLVKVPLASGLRNKSEAIYGEATFHLTSKVDAKAGFRASHEAEALLYSNVDARVELPGIPGVSNTITTPTLRAITYVPRAQYNNAFTPEVGLTYHLTDDTLLYYSYSEAFLSGNFNGLNINSPPAEVKPESTSGNEIGIKSSLLPDRSLKLNAALFNTDVTNAQVQTLALLSGGVTSLRNAGSYTVYGAEVSANWFATEGLVFSLDATYLHGRYGQFIGQGFDSASGLNNNTINFTGNHTVRTPTFTGTASVDYSFPFFFGLDADAAFDGYYTTGFYYDPINDLKQPSYYILNARFGLYDPRTNIRVTAYGKNLNQGVFYTNAYKFDLGSTNIWGAPRTYGVTISWSYGS